MGQEVVFHIPISSMTCPIGVHLEASCDDHLRHKDRGFFEANMRDLHSTFWKIFLSIALIFCHRDSWGGGGV